MIVTIDHNAMDMLNVKVDGRRVGYVNVRDGAKVKWLSRHCIGFELEIEEKLEVLRQVEAKKPAAVAEWKRRRDFAIAIENGEIPNGIDEGSDTSSTGPQADQGAYSRMGD